MASQFKRVRNAAIFECYDGDDLYMIALQGHGGSHQTWSAEVFVNGSSLSVYSGETRQSVIDNAEQCALDEMRDRASRTPEW